MLSTEPQVLTNYADTGKIRYVYYPVLDHTPTQKTYEAAVCAGAQGAEYFWTLHDIFYAEQNRLFSADAALYNELATQAGVPDLTAFSQCLESGQFAAQTLELDRVRRANGIRLRPTFIIGEQLIPGAQSYEQLAQLIEANLTQ